jgi:hypothetical protein
MASKRGGGVDPGQIFLEIRGVPHTFGNVRVLAEWSLRGLERIWCSQVVEGGSWQPPRPRM